MRGAKLAPLDNPPELPGEVALEGRGAAPAAPRPQPSSLDSDNVEGRLAAGKRAMRTIRLRVTGSMIASAILCMALCVVAQLGKHSNWDATAAWQCVIGVSIVGFILCTNLSARPTDRRLIQFLYCFHLVVGGLFQVIAHLANLEETVKSARSAETCSARLYGRPVSSGALCAYYAFSSGVYACTSFFLVFLGHLYYLCYPKTQLEQIERLFRIQKAYFSIAALLQPVTCVFLVLYVAAPLANVLANLFTAGCFLFLIAVAHKKTWREHFTSRLGQLFDSHAATASAAGIACLLGDANVREVLAQARARFRGVRLSALAEADLADSAPDPALFERTTPATLGGLDAFVSHSWRDAPGPKWAQLRQFSDEQAAANDGRGPLLWIDKWCDAFVFLCTARVCPLTRALGARSCIDQRDIETNLRCLPIFLSGCQKLVILLGKTYLTRLWCIVEIFAFVHMGGKPSDIVILPVIDSSDETELATFLEASLSLEFDARDCDCHVAQEKDKILTIIETAFGGYDAFNAEVKALLKRTRNMARSPRAKLSPRAESRGESAFLFPTPKDARVSVVPAEAPGVACPDPPV